MTMTKRTNLRNEQGQSLTEFALMLPILLLVLFGIVQLGIVFNHYITVADASRAGARKAVVSQQAANPTAAAVNAARASATNLTQSKFTVTVSSSWADGADVTVTTSYPYQVSLLGVVVTSGTLSSTTTERLE